MSYSIENLTTAYEEAQQVYETRDTTVFGMAMPVFTLQEQLKQVHQTLENDAGGLEEKLGKLLLDIQYGEYISCKFVQKNDSSSSIAGYLAGVSQLMAAHGRRATLNDQEIENLKAKVIGFINNESLLIRTKDFQQETAALARFILFGDNADAV